MPPATRKPAAKKTAAKKTPARKPRPVVQAPKPPVIDRTKTEGPAPVSEENNNNEDKPKRGRKPNVVGQASARFQKARANLARWEKRAAKVQSVNDGLAAAKAEFEEAQAAYREAFEASLNNTPAPVEDDGDDDE